MDARACRSWSSNLLMGLMLCSLLASVGAAVAGAPSGPQAGLVVLNYDLQGAKGPLPVAQFGQLKALLMYLTPDVVALHSVLKDAGGTAGSVLAQAALAMDMYYAYQPMDDRVGSAVLSRYPIRGATALFDDKTETTLGVQLTVQAEAASYHLFVVRPPTAAVSRTTTAAVLQQTKALAGTSYLVCASFGPAGGAKQALAEWTRAGMYDPLGKLRRPGPETYPYARPKDRLDLVLLGPKLRGSLRRSEVMQKNARLAGLSEHLPVVVTLRR